MKVIVTRSQVLDIEVPDGRSIEEATRIATDLAQGDASRWMDTPATYAAASGVPLFPWVVPDEDPRVAGLKLGACYALGEPLPPGLSEAARAQIHMWGDAGPGDAGPAAIWTGETRPPLAGEWMLCPGGGYRTSAHMAKAGLLAPFPIARLVMVRRRCLTPNTEGHVMVVTPLDAPKGGGR